MTLHPCSSQLAVVSGMEGEDSDLENWPIFK